MSQCSAAHFFFFFFNDTATTEIYTLSLHDALPIYFVVPVVVAAAQRGDLPVYFNGLGTVTAFNTVTVRSRVDGQIVNVAFKEGQYVHEGDVLVQIDRKSTRLNSSHGYISYAVFCLK